MSPDTPPDLASLSADIAAIPGALRNAFAASRTTFTAMGDGVRATRAEIARTTEASKTLSQTLSSGLDRAFTSALKDGAKLSDVLRSLALDVSGSIASKAIGGLTGQVSDLLGGALGQGIGSIFGFAKGAAFDSGKVRAFANGGIVNGPTLFPMQGATGLMGEAGPEAILPLQRTADGRLGVAAGQGGGGAPSITVNIVTQDADSFARSRTQVAATLARAVDRGRRNL